MLVQLTTDIPWENQYSKAWGQITIRLVLSVAVSFFKKCSTPVAQIMGGGRSTVATGQISKFTRLTDSTD